MNGLEGGQASCSQRSWETWQPGTTKPTLASPPDSESGICSAGRAHQPWGLRPTAGSLQARLRLGPGSVSESMTSVMGLALGTILTGVGIMAYRRWRAGCLSVLPGHWLLMLGLAAAVANGVAIGVFQFLTRLYYPPSKWPPGTVNLPKVLLVQFLISKFPDLIAVYHQAVGWGLGAAAALALSWHLRRRLSRPWLSVFVVFGLAAATLSAGHVQSLIRIQVSPTLRPIGPGASSRPTSTRGSFCSGPS